MTTNKNKKQQTYRLLIVSLFLVLAAFFCFSNKSFAATKKTTLKKNFGINLCKRYIYNIFKK